MNSRQKGKRIGKVLVGALSGAMVAITNHLDAASDPNTIIVVLPVPPRILSPNARAHYMAVANAKKKYRQQAAAAARASIGIGTNMGTPWKTASVQATFYHKINRRRDADNALASLKAAFDGLRDAGLIEDDSGLTHLPVRFAKAQGGDPLVILVVKRTDAILATREQEAA